MLFPRLAVILLAVGASAASKCAPDDDADLATCTTALADARAEVDALTAQCAPGEVTAREGGVVVSDDGGAVLSVPPGALPADTTFTIKPADPPDVVADFASGIYAVDGGEVSQFDAPVEICLRATGDRGGDGCLGYYDESGRSWRCQDECLKGHDDLLCGQTDHLTSFAILLGGSTGKDACGDDDWITRRKGGVVSAADDRAFVSVPPLALEVDTTITILAGAPPAADVARLTDVYTFGPDGTKFADAATVCLEAEKPDTKGGCLGFVDASVDPPKWVCEDRCLTRDGTTLCGKTTHFTSFAILLEGGATDLECGK